MFDSESLLQDIDPQWINRIPYAYAKSNAVMALNKRSDKVVVLCTSRLALPVITEIRRCVGSPVSFKQLAQSDFDHILHRAYDSTQSEATKIIDDLGDGFDLERLAQEIPETTDLLDSTDEAPVAGLINALLSQAIREDASDIHLEPFEYRSVVRFRIDGVLRDVVEPQRALHGSLVSRIKVMASLDIAEKRLPQDGRISLKIGEEPFDVRISTLPTHHGERVVLRLLDKKGMKIDLQTLGMSNKMQATFDQINQTPHGIFLVTGPTGSGKTTTLYAGLSRLNRNQLNILTVEDPIEYDLDGVSQTQVKSSIGLSFASGLRSILRQDPDVILVGEIRDLETAEVAVQASLTGHLVLSTLHTNTAIGAVMRLIDMGIEPFLISSSLLAVLAQRLVRVLCSHCKQPYEPKADVFKNLSLQPGDTIFRPKGCNRCDFTGYKGRIGIFELIVLNDTLRAMVHDGVGEHELLKMAREKSSSLMEDGYAKVRDGVSAYEEVLRVVQS